eukprot:TRINITY_DN11311_c0_g1_i4.p1 TRINITY_DN11311_c0_g1~~TRINITY_DN11311_c0_g1_i4.p1  ORF type:complete len:346 (+),score=123.10 TRINITY_DN11311_c0_g1_i4:236-1273(+)
MMSNGGQLERQVEPKRWLMQLAPLQVAGGLHTIDWMVAVMLPQNDVMRSVNENNRILRAELGASEENTRRELSQRTVDAVFIAVAVALASVIVLTFFNDLITRPFAQLAHDMLAVAVLQTDRFEADSSPIQELNAMMRAMHLMVENMTNYKRFMPATLLVNYEDELVSGEVFCGNLGTDTMRKFSFFGVTIPWSHAVERYARSISPGLMLTDEVVHHEVKDHFRMRVAALCRFPKRAKSRAYPLYQLIGTLAKDEEVQEQEWMYRMEQTERQNPWKLYNAVWELLLAGDAEKAAALAASIEAPIQEHSAEATALRTQEMQLEAALDKKLRSALSSASWADHILYH